MKLFYSPFLFLSALILVPFMAIGLYLDTERNFVFWDFAMYYEMARLLWMQPSFGSGFNIFIESLAQNYNLFFALPSLASFSIFSSSRHVFILTNYIVFFSLYQLGCAALLRHIFNSSWKKSLLLGFGLTPLIPFLWVPLLEGYPDHGAAALLCFAVGLGVSQKKNWGKMVTIGALLGCAIVFRRPYAFAALSIILTFGLFDIPFFIKARLKEKVMLFFKYLSMSFALLGTVALLEPLYLKSMFTINYIGLYQSYQWPVSYFMHYCAGQLGWLLLLASAGGYVYAWNSRPKIKKILAKIIAITLIWLVLWGIGPAQIGHHYLISILPLFCLVGLSSYFISPPKNIIVGIAGGSLLVGLIFNSLYSFWLAPHFVYPSEKPQLSFLSTPRIPWVRDDYDEIIELGNYLTQTTGPQDRIVVVGSSFVFNQHLLRVSLTDYKTTLRLLAAPEIDSQQSLPIQAYALGTVFLVASPTQYHLDPNAQKVITALDSLFPPQKSVEQYFKKDTRSFSLSDSVRLNIWRRHKNWDLKDLNNNLQIIKNYKL